MKNQNILDEVILDPKARASVNYAKSRIAIDSAAVSRAERRRLRNIVIEAFHGSVSNGEVVFPDNSKARF